MDAGIHSFSLVELLAGVAIVALLSALLFPSLQKAIEQSRRAACAENLHQLGAAVANYLSDHDMTFPPATDSGNPSWSSHLAPELGAPTDSAGQSRFLHITKAFACPSDNIPRVSTLSVFAKCSYALNYQVQNGDVNGHTPPVRAASVSAPASTILIAERWNKGNLAHSSLGASVGLFDSALKGLTNSGSGTPTGFHSLRVSNFLMVDGHVEMLTEAEASNLWLFVR